MKRYLSSFIILLLLSIGNVYSQTITKKLLVDKLTNGSSKTWYRSRSLDKTADRQPGALKYSFSKTSREFKVYECDHVMKWVCTETRKWNIDDYDPEARGFHGFRLKIGDEYVNFRFDSSYKILYLKFATWEYEKVLE